MEQETAWERGYPLPTWAIWGSMIVSFPLHCNIGNTEYCKERRGAGISYLLSFLGNCISMEGTHGCRQD